MPRHDPVPPRRKPPRPIANATAWARYWRVMGWMTLFALACVGAMLGYLRWSQGPLPFHMWIAVSIGTFLTVMVGTGLMSLLFLSAGSGHDEVANEPFEE